MSDSLKERLTKEILRSRHIPTIVGVGSSDNMKYGSEAFKIVADELGADCQFKMYPTNHGGSPKLVWKDEENLKWLFAQRKKKFIPDDPYPDADYTAPLNTRTIEMITYTPSETKKYAVIVDGVEIALYSSEAEALELGSNAKRQSPDKTVKVEQRQEVTVGIEEPVQVQP